MHGGLLEGELDEKREHGVNGGHSADHWRTTPNETPRAAIARIDKAIDENRKRADPVGRREREAALFSLRGWARLARDHMEAERAMREARSQRPKKIPRCPKCGR